MAVIGPYGVVLEVPSLEAGIEFYTDAGLAVNVDAERASFNCVGREEPCITLIGGAPRKRLHHLALRADPDKIDEIREFVPACGGRIVEAADGFTDGDLWIEDPHGTLIELRFLADEAALDRAEPFAINEPGRIVRRDQSGIPPKASIEPVRPLRLGHVLLFTPDVLRSVAFFEDALGMCLSDFSGDAVAFMCTRQNSDHHVVAFAKSREIGFHHASFQVASPDDVGRGGRQLADKGGRGDWGFGRHTIGANFFHYIQDPWGSWFEYYADMDFISDYAVWTPTDYESEDSLYNWGPAVPDDFVHNYEGDDSDELEARGLIP